MFTGLLAADETTTAEERAAIAELERIAHGEVTCSDMVALARRFLPLVTEPAMWAARIGTMPTIRVLPPPVRDWDAVIGDGEATLSTVSERYRRYVARPLATAYHQRACRSFAAGALEAARVDLERAVEIDPYVEHYTTLAVVLDRMGRREAARAVLARGIVGVRAWGPVYEDGIIVAAGDHGPPEDLARALEVTGLFALHDGDPAAAESALREALTLAPSASQAHARR